MILDARGADALEEARAALAARVVPFHILPEDYPPATPAMRIAFRTDPDGNVIELLQPLGSRCEGRRGMGWIGATG